jgi:hypothetical protein
MSVKLTLVTVTSTSQTLAQLLVAAGSTVDSGLRVLNLQPTATGIFYANGTASAASAPLGSGISGLECDGSVASDLQFYAATNIEMTVVQEY